MSNSAWTKDCKPWGMALSMKLVVALAWCSSALLSPAAAAAQAKPETEAKALFAAGREAFDAGRFDAALWRWQEAYDLSARPQLLYNLGLAYDRLGRKREAIAKYEAFVAALPNDEHAAEARARVAALKAAPIPTPAQTAAAAPPPATTPPPHAVSKGPKPTEDRPWHNRWYVWAGVGAAVVAGTVVAIVATSPSSPETTRATPNSGVTVQALGGSW
jgi:tetratricopeptide (TPR) repeat protein